MGKPQPLFKDAQKRLTDLLTKEFPSEKQENRIEWKGDAPNNVAFETNFAFKKDGAVIGTFIPKYKRSYNGWNAVFSGELNTKKEWKGEVSVEGTAVNVPGLKTVLTGQSKDEDIFTTVGLEYRHEVTSANVSVDYGKAKGSTVKGAVVLGTNGYYFGASAEYFLGVKESELKEVHTVLGYAAKEYDASVYAKLDGRGDEDKNEFGATYFHQVQENLAVGTEVSFDTTTPEAKPKLVFGTQYLWNADSVIKGKFDTTGKLGISISQKINKNTKVILSSSIDTNNMNAKGASNFGFTLSLTD